MEMMSRLTWDGPAEPSRETKFSGASADREIFIFPVQLTTCRIGSRTRFIHTLDLLYVLSYMMHRGDNPLSLTKPTGIQIATKTRTSEIYPSRLNDVFGTNYSFLASEQPAHCLFVFVWFFFCLLFSIFFAASIYLHLGLICS